MPPTVSAILFGASVTAPANSNTVAVTGAFPTPYEVAAQPAQGNWQTTITATQKTATGFTLTYAVSPAVDSQIDYFIVTPQAPGGISPIVTAGDLINNVRWKIPDPVLDANGNPQPDGNGLWPAQALYGWLDDAVRELARLVGAQIEDWTAIPQVFNQPWYNVDVLFQGIVGGFSNQWPLDVQALSELDVIWPSTSNMTAQSLWGYIRTRKQGLQFGLFPIPNLQDPRTTLTAPIGTSANVTINLADATNFLSFSYVQIDNEIIQYQNLTGTQLTILSRGVCGTSAASHLSGAAVQHLGLWLKGVRAPARVVNSLSAVELPLDLIQVVKDYVLAQVRQSENEFAESDRLMKQFDRKCAEIRGDPTREQSTWEITPFGSPRLGPIYFPWSGGIVRP